MLAFPPYTSLYFQDLPQTPNALIPLLLPPPPQSPTAPANSRHIEARQGHSHRPGRTWCGRGSRTSKGVGATKIRKYGLTWQSLRQGKSC